jgi:hypothetical protein
MVQIFGRIRVSRYNVDRKQVSCPLIVILLTAQVQCRAVPRRSEAKAGVKTISKPEIKVQDFNCGQMRVSGCNGHYKFVLGAGAPACRQAGKQKV